MANKLEGVNMSNRFKNVGNVMVLGLLLVSSCSGPANSPEKTTSANTITSSSEEATDIAQATVPESPKPVAAEAVAPAPVMKAPATKAAAPAPAPAPVPVPAKAKDVAAAPVPVPSPSAPVPVPSAAAPVPVPAATAPVPVAPAPVAPVEPPAPPAPTSRAVSVPSGTMVSLRMIDTVDSKTDHVGQTYKATLDSAVIVDGQTVFPKGEDVFVKLAKVQSAGNMSGTSEIQLELDRIFLGSKAYTVTSNVYQSVGDSQGKKAVKQTGIGAGIGAVIGAIAGGGKGAAIGAGVGGGAGAAATAIGKGEQVRVESEAKLTFRLEEPLSVTIPINPAASASRNVTTR